MLDWFFSLFQPAATPSVAQSVVVLCLAIAAGTVLGRVRVRGVSIGVAGVMFAGLTLGHFGFRLQPETLVFVRDAGLILFVYAIGLQVGPAFFTSLRREGLLFNALAVAAILLSTGLAVVIMLATGTGADNMVGVLSGAVTNTPGLGAAKAALADLARARPGRVFHDPANGYALAYPLGATGIILTLLILRAAFRIKTPAELERFDAEARQKYPRPENVRCRVTNPWAFGRTVGEVQRTVGGEGIIITRIRHSGSPHVATPGPDTVLEERDVVMVVGLPEEVGRAIAMLGRQSTDAIIFDEADTVTRHFFVTQDSAVQQSLAQLNLEGRFGAKVSRVYRAGLEFLAAPDFVVHYGDRLRVVGPAASMPGVQDALGDSIRRLSEPDLLPIFTGIILGVVVGSLPIAVPGLPVAVRPGLAAGPLVVAILISRFGGIGTLHSFLNQSAALFMREFGVALFLAAVGLTAGESFYRTFVEFGGWWWILYGACITLIPALVVGFVARAVFRLNYLQLAGVLGGAYTSPPTLAFTTTFFGSDIPAQAYAMVFPLALLLRILLAQLFVLYFF
jgi:putative transport protein